MHSELQSNSKCINIKEIYTMVMLNISKKTPSNIIYKNYYIKTYQSIEKMALIFYANLTHD